MDSHKTVLLGNMTDNQPNDDDPTTDPQPDQHETNQQPKLIENQSEKECPTG